MVQFCTKKAPAFVDALNSRHAPEQNGRRPRKIGSNRSMLKPPDNGLGHSQAAHLLAAGRRCAARSIICELAAPRVTRDQYVCCYVCRGFVCCCGHRTDGPLWFLSVAEQQKLSFSGRATARPRARRGREQQTTNATPLPPWHLACILSHGMPATCAL